MSRRCRRKTVGLKSLFPGQHLTVIYIHLLEAVGPRKCSSCTMNYKPITTQIYLMEEVFFSFLRRSSPLNTRARRSLGFLINHPLYSYLLPGLPRCLLNGITSREHRPDARVYKIYHRHAVAVGPYAATRGLDMIYNILTYTRAYTYNIHTRLKHPPRAYSRGGSKPSDAPEEHTRPPVVITLCFGCL